MANVGDLAIFWTIVALRVLIPLTIPRFPLPGIIAALVLDAIDQSLFQALTDLQLDGYQGYDKALDIYYLAIAYIATMRNWMNNWAFRISRFLFYYRLIGVVLFEVLQFRWLLLAFPNVFEYFFIFYEIVRLRWDPRRLSGTSLAGVAALIWIVIKLPQEYWIHIAQLDVTDMLKVNVLGYPPTADWGDILAANPIMILLFAAALGLLVYLLWRWLRAKLPPPDWELSFEPDAHLPRPPKTIMKWTVMALVGRFLDFELFEKTALVTLLVIIFAQIMPGIRSSNIELALAMVIVIVINTAVSESMVRRGVRWSRFGRQLAVMLAINLPVMLLISFLRYGSIPLLAFNNIIVFILLLSLIITLYDRYRPLYLVRFVEGFQ